MFSITKGKASSKLSPWSHRRETGLGEEGSETGQRSCSIVDGIENVLSQPTAETPQLQAVPVSGVRQTAKCL